MTINLTEETNAKQSEQNSNVAAYLNQEAVNYWSFYRPLPEEDYLFGKYYAPGESILDLACGMGRTSLVLHERGHKVRGLDRSELFIQSAKRRFPYLDLNVGSFDRIEEPDASFSHVLIAFNSIDCALPMQQRLAALRECVRVLKPGGTLIYSSHNIRSLRFYSPYYIFSFRWKLQHLFKAFTRGAYVHEDDQYLFFASPRFVIEQTESLGLRLLETNSSSFHRTRIQVVDRYFAPYIHYVFLKPTSHSEFTD